MKSKKIIFAVICIVTVCGFLAAACNNTATPHNRKPAAVAVNNVTLDKSAITLEAGKSEQLIYTISPPTASNKKVSWESNDTDVATVSTSGRVSGVSEGNAKITVTAEDGFFSAECAVTVTPRPLPSRPWNSEEPDTPWVAGNATVDIYSFNDFHGTLDSTASASNPGAAKFAAAVKDLMSQGSEHSILLAAGDNYQGSALSNYFYGEPVSKMMKELGVKYSAVGNHEWDWGSEMFAQFAADGDLDFLAADIFIKGTEEQPDFCHPYVIANRAGRKIGIVGLTVTETPSLVSASLVETYEFREPGVWLKNMVADLKTVQGCDAVVALTHKSSGSTLTANGNEIGFDAIITGHSHQPVNTTSNGVPVVQASYNGRALAKLSFQFNDHNLVSVTPSLTNISTSGPGDAAVAAMLAAYETQIGSILNEVIGVFGPGISAGKNPWANQLVFDYTVRTRPEYKDIVLVQNAGGWRTVMVGGPGDNVTVGFLWSLMPFDNEIYIFDLRGDYLMNILKGRNATDSGGLGTPPVITNASGGGSNWTVTSTGEKIDSTKTYKVSMNDFMYSGGDNYGVEEYASNLVILGVPLRDAMIDQLKWRTANGVNPPISSPTIGNLSGGPLVPEYAIKAANTRYVQDTALIHLTNDAMIYYANAAGHKVTLSGTAPLSPDANAAEGKITANDMNSVYYYENSLYVVEMTGNQFKEWMEWAHWDFHRTNMKPGDLIIPYGGGNGYNFDQFKGLTYKVDLTKDRGQRIVQMKNPDGSAFDLTKTYLVAVNNHRANNQLTDGTIYASPDAITIKATGVDVSLTVDGETIQNYNGMKGLIADYIQRVKGGEITNAFTPSWEFIMPDAGESWYAEYRAAAVDLLNSGKLQFIADTPVTKDVIEVYLATGELPDLEPPPSPIRLDFENSKWNINAYSGASAITDVGLHWSVRGYGQPDENDRHVGARSMRLRGNAADDNNYVELTDYLKYGIQSVSFKYGSYSGHSGGVLILFTQTKGTATWTEKDRVTASAWGGEMETKTVTLNISEPVRFKIEKVIVTGSGTSVNIDDIVITYSK